MLLSTKNKFIFIHNPKVAGNSIRKALESYCVPQKPNFALRKLVSPTFRKYSNELQKNIVYKISVNSLPNNLKEIYAEKLASLIQPHYRAEYIKNFLPDKIYNEYFKFGFVRNPWDLQVSLYFFILETKKHHFHEEVKSLNSFDEYLEWLVVKFKYLQKDFFTDESGNLIVDFVGKFETINEDMQKVLKAINLDGQVVLEHVNKSNHENYMSYYNKHTYKLIEEHYKEDIEMFGYY